MSVFSDDESIPAEEGKEAWRTPENLAASFASDVVDDNRCGWEHEDCMGAEYEEWAAFVAANKASTTNHQRGSSMITQKGDDETSEGSILLEDQADDEVTEYNLAACRGKIFCSNDYVVTRATTDGIAAQVAQDTTSGRNKSAEGS